MIIITLNFTLPLVLVGIVVYDFVDVTLHISEVFVCWMNDTNASILFIGTDDVVCLNHSIILLFSL